MDVNVQSDNGLSCSEGLEELFTDFDCWITRWNIRLKKRSPANKHEIIRVLSNNEQENKEDRHAVTNKLQELLVNGFLVNKTLLASANDANRLDLHRPNDDLNSIDYVILRLVKENGRRRVVIINKSKL